jgi:hypothetical protein
MRLYRIMSIRQEQLVIPLVLWSSEDVTRHGNILHLIT